MLSRKKLIELCNENLIQTNIKMNRDQMYHLIDTKKKATESGYLSIHTTQNSRTIDNWKKLTKNDLIKLCRDSNITINSKMNKAMLYECFLKNNTTKKYQLRLQKNTKQDIKLSDLPEDILIKIFSFMFIEKPHEFLCKALRVINYEYCYILMCAITMSLHEECYFRSNDDHGILDYNQFLIYPSHNIVNLQDVKKTYGIPFIRRFDMYTWSFHCLNNNHLKSVIDQIVQVYNYFKNNIADIPTNPSPDNDDILEHIISSQNELAYTTQDNSQKYILQKILHMSTDDKIFILNQLEILQDLNKNLPYLLAKGLKLNLFFVNEIQPQICVVETIHRKWIEVKNLSNDKIYKIDKTTIIAKYHTL